MDLRLPKLHESKSLWILAPSLLGFGIGIGIFH